MKKWLMIFAVVGVYCSALNGLKIPDRYSDIKSEHLIIYNKHKYLMTLAEFNKNKFAYESLNFAIEKLNENRYQDYYYKLHRLLNAYKQPYDDEIYTFNVDLIKTRCDGTKADRGFRSCRILQPTHLINCVMKILVRSWEANLNERFKIYQIKC
jgi:hypothetical protein